MSTNTDVQDLVDAPRETLEIETKSHLDLTQPLDRANVARHICALANYGGGYIVFGFDDHLKPVPLPADIEKLYHRDVIASIVSKYLNPPLPCDVAFVRASSGEAHPIVLVPPHAAVPICAKANGPNDARGAPQGILKGRHYMRRLGGSGPESAAIEDPADWEKVIRRCVLADRATLLTQISGLLPPASRSSTDADPLLAWHTAAHRRFLEELASSKQQWPVPLDKNHCELSYRIVTAPNQRIRPAELISALEAANRATRELVWTGWSMFYVFSRPEIAPKFVTDPSSSEENHDFLEASIIGSSMLDTTLPDFWRVSTSGKVSLLRAYREDRNPSGFRGLMPGTWLSPFWLAREISELIRHAVSFAEQFPTAERIAFRLEWFGLKDRNIADAEADWSIDRVAHSNEKLVAGDWTLQELATNWPEIVSEIASSVVRMFDAELSLTPDWVRRQASKFRSL